MNRYSLERIARLLGVALLLACHQEVDAPPDPCAATLQAILQLDCDRTLQCRAAQGELTVTANLLDQCVKASGQQLSTQGLRAQFLTNFGRCSSLSRCDYTSCVGTGAHGFGETQLTSVTYNCIQSTACTSESGMPVCETPQGLSDCIAITTGQLDSLSVAQKQAYVDASARCGQLTGCTYVQCMSP